MRNERQFEVFSHRWIDLTDKSGDYGVTVLTDCKNGSDKPADNTIRLTLLRTPGMQPLGSAYTDQANQDWGHHEFTFGLVGHAGGWRAAGSDWQGYRLNDPMRAFTTNAHPGSLGKTFSLLQLDNSRVRVFALKKAEHGDEIVVRLAELDGKPQQRVAIKFAGPVTSAREVNAQEQPVGEAHVENGTVLTSFGPYQPRTFAVKLADAQHKLTPIASQPIALSYDLAVASNDDTQTTGGGFDGKNDALPAEMLPSKLAFHGVEFSLATPATGKPDAETANGQTLNIPAGSYNRVYVLAASKDSDQPSTFRVGKSEVSVGIQNWGGFIGQWDTRLWKNEPKRDWSISAHHAVWPPADIKQREARLPSSRYPEDYSGLREGYVKRADVAWYASHTHTPEGLNQPYHYSYLFSYAFDVPQGATTLTLPNAPNVRILAVSAVNESPSVLPLTPLYDTLKHSEEPPAKE